MANDTCREIIAEAFEETRAIGMGVTPEDIQADRGLRRLQAMWRAAVEHGTFGRLEEYVATDDYEAEEGQRVYAGGFTISLPTSIVDAYTGLARRPRDQALIMVVDEGADPQISVYDANEAAWTRVDNLALDGECPFSGRYHHDLVAALAQCMSPMLGSGSADITAAYAAALRSAMGARRSAPRTNPSVDFY